MIDRRAWNNKLVSQRASTIVLERAKVWAGVANVARDIQKTARAGSRVPAGSVVAQIVAEARDGSAAVDEIGAARARLENCAVKRK